jgi:ADP-ribosylglycohydrolase
MSDNAQQDEKPMATAISLQTRVRGCLLGGAIGDALGAPVEFMRLAQIKKRFGPDGTVDYAPAYGRIGAITDDTQMTLFTAESVTMSHRQLLYTQVDDPGLDLMLVENFS